MIAAYRDRRGPPNFQLGIASHGAGTAKDILTYIKNEFVFVDILNSRKQGPEHADFVAPLVAPIDRFADWQNHVYRGCGISWRCGIAMNYRGFYPCAVSGALDRLMNLHCFVSDLEHVNESEMIHLWQIYCRWCGYYRDPLTSGKKTIVSKSWHDIVQQLKPKYHQIEYI